ncbi:mannose-6-phosphate isomerase [Komagataeibacter medellinensis]|uniref:Mannose-6-phosphate isomerase n=1 Tax=Komagataeibacter medellinensis TaxID=1177712 RepID=A0ABQ6VV26_9PROT|nr:AGE family epimerase/isomerase [Komagataeibacter medellinensis]KAB8124023.1 mannose-6-phosphate isomerase [Komagataeibacter medellinensis]
MKDIVISTLKQEARAWLVGTAMPLWSCTGRTASGLFAERLTRDGTADPAYFRTFVQARHVYSTIVAGELGWTGPWRSLVAETMHTLTTRARRTDGFFVHQLDRNATVSDGRADLYDQAFILFAFGVAGAALGDEALFDEAEALMDTIERNWSHPLLGFREGEVVDPSVRRQNPHMHLLEAFSALYKASGRRRFGDAAQDMMELCGLRFMHLPTGALLEYFQADWTPVAGKGGCIVEPGHCFEWAWLCEGLAAHWDGAITLSDALTSFGRCHGIDPKRGVVVNEVLTDGRIVNGRARLWPQTERLKIAAARFRRTGSGQDLVEMTQAWRGICLYFLPGQPALWHDKMKEDGRFVEEMVPGSSLYHIVGAIREICSLQQHAIPDGNDIDLSTAS